MQENSSFRHSQLDWESPSLWLRDPHFREDDVEIGYYESFLAKTYY